MHLCNYQTLSPAEPAPVLAQGAVVHYDGDASSLCLGLRFLVYDAVLHPDIFGAHLDGLVHHRHDLIKPAEHVHHVDGLWHRFQVRVALFAQGFLSALPLAPTDLQATDASVTLIWQAPDDEIVTGYLVLRLEPDADPPPPPQMVGQVDAATTEITDSDVQASTA